MNKTTTARLTYLASIAEDGVTPDLLVERLVEQLWFRVLREDLTDYESKDAKETSKTAPVSAPEPNRVVAPRPAPVSYISVGDLSRELVDEIWEMCLSEGVTQKEVASAYSISESSMSLLIKRERSLRDKASNSRSLSEGKIKQIRAARREGKTMRAIAEEFGVDRKTVGRHTSDITLN